MKLVQLNDVMLIFNYCLLWGFALLMLNSLIKHGLIAAE